MFDNSEPVKRERVRHRVGGPVLVKESDAASTDINELMGRYLRTGLVPQKGEEPRYGDFSSGLDYHAALSAVRSVEGEYEALSADVKKRTMNDPGVFLDMVMDPEGRRELEQLGLFETQAPTRAPEAAEAASEVPAEPTGAERAESSALDPSQPSS